jgi:hypothetical protein
VFGKNGGVPTGLQMIMSQFGIDPEAIAKQLEGARDTALATMKHFDARLGAIEEQLKANNKAMAELVTAWHTNQQK